MNIKLELYKIFVEVAKEKNISSAAKNLYISQSAVSQSIKQLENQCGVILLRRKSKGVELTSEGLVLFEYLSSAMNLIHSAEQKMNQMKALDYGVLKIGCSDTITKNYLLPRLEHFNRQYPNINLKVINRTSMESIKLLKSGEIDIAYINLPINDDKIQILSEISVQDIFVGTSIYANKKYTLQQIADLPLIMLEGTSNSRQYVDNFFLTNGVSLSPEIELCSHDLLLDFAKINLGISCVIKEFSADYLLNHELVELQLTQSIPKRSIGITSLKGVSLSNAAKIFIEK